MRISARKIERTFFRKTGQANFFYAVKGTDFTLLEGNITGIIGRSGSGKTTFINMLCGLLRPTSGSIEVDGVDFITLNDDSASLLRNRKFGIIPQSQTPIQSFSVIENVMAPAFIYKSDLSRQEVHNRAKSLLSRLGIESLEDEYPSQLSGGELRRMAIARALINDPEVIIADEPTSDLDDKSTDAVLKLMRELADEGKSVLIVTHDRDAKKICDVIYKMDGGVLKKNTEAASK